MAQRYNRYWDLHLTDRNGSYDFAGSVKSLAATQGTERAHGLGNQLAVQTILVKTSLFGSLTPIPLDDDQHKLPSRDGYVASTAKLTDLQAAVKATDHTALVKWVSDPRFRGKLRVNVHANAGGIMGMGKDDVEPESLVDWLIVNELSGFVPNPLASQQFNSGLATINFSACFSAVDEQLRPSDYGDRRTSVVDRVANRLARKSITGIEVTGANESVGNGGLTVKLVVPTGGSFGKLKTVKDQPVTKRGVVYSTSHFEMEKPPDWTFVLHPTVNRIVLLTPRGTTRTPQGKNTKKSPNGGWVVAGVTVPAESNWLVLEVVGSGDILLRERTPGPLGPNEESRIIVTLSPAWKMDSARQVLVTLPAIHLPGILQAVDRALGAEVRLAHGAGKARRFSGKP